MLPLYGDLMEDEAIYNITIHSGADYQLDLSIVADDDEEITNYGAFVANKILVDGTGSTVSVKLINLSDAWSVSDKVMIYNGYEQGAVGNWTLEAQLREYAEASDYFDFDISIGTDGYEVTMSKDVTETIPYTQGVYDIFVVNTDNGIRSKLLKGNATIIPQVTR